MLEDETLENEENYARRYLQTNEGNTITPVHKCGSEYTQMWELRHARNPSTDSGIDGTPCHPARPLNGEHIPPGDAQLPQSAACCNKKTQSFTTFKPREPIYMRSRGPLNMLFRTSGLDTVHHSAGDVSVYEARHPAVERTNSEQEQVRLLNGSPSKRPDIICSNHGGRRSNDTRVTFAGLDDPESRQLSSTEGLCDHCAMHHSLENVLSEESEQLSQNPST